jgi:hypothetical protein
VINKKPDGMPSPNLADGAMIRYAPMEAPPTAFTQEMVLQIQRAGQGRRRY